MSKVFNMVGGGGATTSIFVKGLSETDTVTATNGSKTKVGVWTQIPNPLANGLPDGYTELEYIESTGTQYIDTEIPANQIYAVDADIIVGSDTDYNPVGNNNPRTMPIGYYSPNGAGFYSEYVAGSQVKSNYIPSSGTECVLHSEYKNGLTVITVNDVTNSVTTSGTLSNTNSVQLFYGRGHRGFSIKAKYFTFFDSNYEKNRHFIPAKRNSDGAIGMYDIVSNTFFGNSGTGTFTAGAEVPQTIGGFLIKPIRDFGTWTVTATDGVRTTTQEVLVDVITEYEIDMHYKLWLYRDGDECEDVTGGWSQKPATGLGNATITKTSTSISWTINTSLLRIATNNKIDLTNYKKLVFQCKQTVSGTVGGTAFIQGACSNPTSQTVTMGSEGTVAHKDPMLNTSYEMTNIEVDISTITGSFYPYVRIDSGLSGLTITGALYKVWLE